MAKQQEVLVTALPCARLVMISSAEGHDRFLLEFKILSQIIEGYMKELCPWIYDGPPQIFEEGSMRIVKDSVFGRWRQVGESLIKNSLSKFAIYKFHFARSNRRSIYQLSPNVAALLFLIIKMHSPYLLQRWSGVKAPLLNSSYWVFGRSRMRIPS